MEQDPVVLNLTINLFPAIVALPIMFLVGDATTILLLDGLGWFFIMFIGIGISGIAYYCLNKGYQDPAMTPEHMSMFTTLVPVFGLVISILAGFAMGWVNLIGAALVIISIVFSNKVPTRASQEPPGIDTTRKANAGVFDNEKTGITQEKKEKV
jgi:drug/metabolite transporter (DMT)-like permease